MCRDNVSKQEDRMNVIYCIWSWIATNPLSSFCFFSFASNSIKPHLAEREKSLTRWFSAVLIKTNEKFSPWLPPQARGHRQRIVFILLFELFWKELLQTPHHYHDALRTNAVTSRLLWKKKSCTDTWFWLLNTVTVNQRPQKYIKESSYPIIIEIMALMLQLTWK